MFCVLREDFLFTERRSLPHVLLQQFKKLFYHRCLYVCVMCVHIHVCHVQPCQLSVVRQGFPREGFLCLYFVPVVQYPGPGYVFYGCPDI